MKILVRRIAAPTLKQWCEEHDLAVEVVERYPASEPAVRGLSRWFATIEDIEVHEDSMLASFHGNGDNPGAAISDLATQLSGHSLVFKYGSPQVREFGVVYFSGDGLEEEEVPK